jgi:hypothetical protein
MFCGVSGFPGGMIGKLFLIYFSGRGRIVGINGGGRHVRICHLFATDNFVGDDYGMEV